MSSEIFKQLVDAASSIISATGTTSRSDITKSQYDRRFRAHFGVSIDIALELYDEILCEFGDDCIVPKHFLWALYFLKAYPTESLAAAAVGVSEKTYRSAVRGAIDQLSKLKLVYLFIILYSFDIQTQYTININMYIHNKLYILQGPLCG